MLAHSPLVNSEEIRLLIISVRTLDFFREGSFSPKQLKFANELFLFSHHFNKIGKDDN